MIIRIISYLLIIYTTYSLIKENTRFICTWNEKYGILCPSCGATRATLSVLKGNIVQAIEYNMVYTVAILPAILLFIVDDILYIILRIFKISKKKSLFETLLEVDSGDNYD